VHTYPNPNPTKLALPCPETTAQWTPLRVTFPQFCGFGEIGGGGVEHRLFYVDRPRCMLIA
jgi:hypothetical protein